MSNPKDMANEKLAASIIKKLEKRNMQGFYYNTSKEAIEAITKMLPNNASVSFGGSASIAECGMLSSLRNNSNIRLIDREQASSAEEKQKMYFDSFSCDYYFMSTNAISIDGELVNIDATGNRVAALTFGPKNVIIIAGMNKIATDRLSAIDRVQNQATPPNCLRLGMKTPCAVTGHCADCHSDQTLCCQVLITRHSFIKNRIKVFLINETLGF